MHNQLGTLKSSVEHEAQAQVVQYPASGERRRAERYSCDWPAVCYVKTTHTIDVRVKDVSEHGMRLDRPLSLEVGEYLQVYMADIGVFKCRVIWCKEQSTGVEIIDEHLLSENQILELKLPSALE